jgi:hypothetical protein
MPIKAPIHKIPGRVPMATDAARHNPDHKVPVLIKFMLPGNIFRFHRTQQHPFPPLTSAGSII